MPTLLYRLRFTGPVHFGSTGIGMENSQERLTSDSLTSALINALAVLDLADDAVEALKGTSPAFILAGLFPFAQVSQNSRPLYLFPKPLAPPMVAEDTSLRRYGKDIKKVRYLEALHLRDWLTEKPLADHTLKAIVENAGIPEGGENDKTGTHWWRHELRPRVGLDRSSSNSSIWLCDTLKFAESAGLFGLVSFNDNAWRNPLEGAFHLLGDLGLGGERTYGMGSFEFSGFENPPDDIRALLEMKSDRHLLLSSYYPAETERAKLEQHLLAWDFREIRGYVVSGRMATTLKRKRVRMLTEGSVFSHPLKGAVVDVSPDDYRSFGLKHPIYRSGLAFFAPQGGQSCCQR